MFIKENLPHLGLLEGDELLQINGAPANSIAACKAALTTAMALSLELRRRGHSGIIQRLPEPSVAGGSSSKEYSLAHPGESWGSGLWRRLGISSRLWCMAGTGHMDEHTGADRSHDIDMSMAFPEDQLTQPV